MKFAASCTWFFDGYLIVTKLLHQDMNSSAGDRLYRLLKYGNSREM